MKPETHRGFTLIEVLVAFSILSLTLAAVFALLSSGTRNTRISDEYSKAVVLAESKMAELGVTDPLRTGLTRGRFNSTYTWEMRVTMQQRQREYPHEDYAWDILNVNLKVSWLGMGDERDLTISTMRLAPRE